MNIEPRIGKLADFKDEIKSHLRRQQLFPIIGSGFTRGCKTSRGFDVPSGNDMLSYMKQYLVLHGKPEPHESAFSKVALYYEKVATEKDRLEYLQNHFMNVTLSGPRVDFLNINWKFLYTLNLDDAIEKNSPYNNVVLPNSEYNFENLSKEKCVFKLHGDAGNIVTYKGSNMSILSTVQYIQSIETSKDMLDKLRIDLNYSNVIFVGCSLNDELDLLSVAQHLSDSGATKKNRYYVTSGRPDDYQMIELTTYGIDTIIIVDSYDDFYREFIDIAKQCDFILEDELSSFCNLNIVNAEAKKNIDYLLCGTFLHNKSKGQICIPSFFIERDIEKKIIEAMPDERVQIIHGTRVSGKSYLLVSLMRKVLNRDRYYFDSRCHVDADLIKHLLKATHTVFFFDTNVLTIDALQVLLNIKSETLVNSHLNIILCINNSDRDMLEIVATSKTLGEQIGLYELSNRLVSGLTKRPGELEIINSKLKKAGLIPFKPKISLLDNLLDLHKEMRTNKPNKFDAPLSLYPREVGKVCLLILLAQNEKVTASDITRCGLLQDSAFLLRDLKVTIEEDHRSVLFLNSFDSADYQIVCNAKVWMLNQLREIGQNQLLENTIIKAFARLITSFLGKTKQFGRVENLVKFDKLNEIFPDGKRLIIKIYDGIKPTLQESYQYFHQLAKCRLWGIAKPDYSSGELNEARIAAITSKRMIEAQRSYFESPKGQLAYAHILNTLTIIYTKLCLFEDFCNPDTIRETVCYFSDAIVRVGNRNAMITAKHSQNNNIYQWILKAVSEEVIPLELKADVNSILSVWQSL